MIYSGCRVLLAATFLGAASTAFAQSAELPVLSWIIPPSHADSLSVERITAFHTAWGAAWRRSEAARHLLDESWGLEDPPRIARRATDDFIVAGGTSRRINVTFSNARCWGVDGLPEPGFDSIRSTLRHRWLVSSYNRFGVCPTWFGERVPRPGDERLSLDEALVADERESIRRQRAALLATLTDALGRGTPSRFLRGQVIRFAVDQGDTATALATLAACAGSADWWCHFLQGYALASAGSLPAAEEAFRAAMTLAPPELRCRLEDVSYLTDERGGGRHRAAQCTPASRAAAAWAWTLADPLWMQPGNERLVEHFVRHAQVILRGSLPRDERHSWSERDGNDARRAMILRYGWPSYMWWNGPKTDSTRVSFDRNKNAPYTGYEYFPGRLHLMPPAAALANPFDWESSAQTWMAPPGHDSPSVNAPLWFPVEHFAPLAPLVLLPEGQTAMLRRQQTILLGTATLLDVALLRRGAERPVSDITLHVAQAPDSVRMVARADGETGRPVVLTAEIDPRPSVIGVELSSSGSRWPAARARYGVRPPAALDAMPPGSIATSAPVLLRVPGGVQQLPSTPEGALHWMYGTTTLRSGEPLGVYWETYGIAPDEPVELAVWIQRVTRQNPLRRLGISLNIATDRNTPVAVHWTEARLGATGTDLGGPVRIIGRSIVLDVGRLPAGDYVIEVAARARDAEAVRGQRYFTVR